MNSQELSIQEALMKHGRGIASLSEAREVKKLDFFTSIGRRSYKPKRFRFSLEVLYFQLVGVLISSVLFGLLIGMKMHEAVFLILVALPIWCCVTFVRLYTALGPIRERRKLIAVRRSMHKAYFKRKKFFKEYWKEKNKEKKQVDFEKELAQLDEEFASVIEDGKKFADSLGLPVCSKQNRSKLNNPAHVEKVLQRKFDSPVVQAKSVKDLKIVDGKSQFTIAGLSLAPARSSHPSNQIEIDL